jgi:hypothetical protein
METLIISEGSGRGSQARVGAVLGDDWLPVYRASIRVLQSIYYTSTLEGLARSMVDLSSSIYGYVSGTYERC